MHSVKYFTFASVYLRVIPHWPSPSRVSWKKSPEKKMAAQTPGDKMHANGGSDLTCILMQQSIPAVPFTPPPPPPPGTPGAFSHAWGGGALAIFLRRG